MKKSVIEYRSVNDKLRDIEGSLRNVSQKDIDISHYVVEKSLKIASATLLVLKDNTSDSALRSEIEKTSVRLIEDAVSACFNEHGQDAFLRTVRMLVALLESASLVQSVSQRNALIIIGETIDLIQFIQEVSWRENRAALDTALLDLEVPRRAYETETLKRHVYAPSSLSANRTGSIGHTLGGHDAKDYDESEKDVAKPARQYYRERMQDIQKDRRTVILSILQKKDRITVKDVSHVIKDCSEKTIQRELLALVGQGVLKKEGERRWSTYSLAA